MSPNHEFSGRSKCSSSARRWSVRCRRTRYWSYKWKIRTTGTCLDRAARIRDQGTDVSADWPFLRTASMILSPGHHTALKTCILWPTNQSHHSCWQPFRRQTSFPGETHAPRTRPTEWLRSCGPRRWPI